MAAGCHESRNNTCGKHMYVVKSSKIRKVRLCVKIEKERFARMSEKIGRRKIDNLIDRQIDI